MRTEYPRDSGTTCKGSLFLEAESDSIRKNRWLSCVGRWIGWMPGQNQVCGSKPNIQIRTRGTSTNPGAEGAWQKAKLQTERRGRRRKGAEVSALCFSPSGIWKQQLPCAEVNGNTARRRRYLPRLYPQLAQILEGSRASCFQRSIFIQFGQWGE